MKAIAATLFFALFSTHSAIAAECASHSGCERVNNAAACVRPADHQVGPVAVFQLSYQLSLPTAYRQSANTGGNEYAAAGLSGRRPGG